MVANLARAWSARIIEPIARFLGSLGLSPNAVTILGFFLTVAVAGVLASGRLLLAGILLIVTLAFDAVDGTLARISGQTTRFGAFLDSTLDRWAEVSYTRARAEGIGLECKEGILTRFERMVILILGLIAGQLIWALAIIAALAGITAVQRILVTWQGFKASR
jgi:CDP-diacylglycerol--glycerol-3-phosphate 3-phosphatidyltransferase